MLYHVSLGHDDLNYKELTNRKRVNISHKKVLTVLFLPRKCYLMFYLVMTIITTRN